MIFNKHKSPDISDIYEEDELSTEPSAFEEDLTGENSITEENEDFTKMPKATFGYSLICLIAIVIFSTIYVIAMNLNYTYITVSTSFSEIAQGHNPDGSPFDIYEVMSDEVLENACNKLENKVDAETLRKHLSVTGLTSDGTFNSIRNNVLDSNDTYSYFPSRYTITYSIVSDSISEDGILASIKAVLNQASLPSRSEMLSAVAQSYKDYYENKYVINGEIFDIDWSTTKSLDFFNRAGEMKNILNRMNRYLAKRYDEDVKFVSKSGSSFGDLNAEITRIIDNDIESYKSFIIQNGITLDKDKLMKQFKYVSDINYEETERRRGEYSIMLDGISIYDPNTTKVVFIPALDSDDIFYMNRTKIGIDYLTENASFANLSGDTAENKAHYYDYLCNQFQNAENTEEWVIRTAEQRCDNIIAKIDDFCKRASDVNKEYINSVSYEVMDVSDTYQGQSLIPSAVAIVKITVILSSILYILWVAYSVLIKKRKTQKEGEDFDVNK